MTTIVTALLLFLPLSDAVAQSPVRDSLSPGRVNHQSIGIHPIFRRYTVDTVHVTERGLAINYSVRAGRARFQLSGGPLRFSDGSTTISGASPVEGKARLAFGARDTVTVSVRAPSMPGSLNSREVAAVGSVGTATIDLESISFGTPAAGGAAVTFARPLGRLIGSIRIGSELELRPNSVDSVYWRGFTGRIGAGLAAFVGDLRISGEIALARSTADSLGGRNLFPGGGSFLVRAGAAGLMSEKSDAMGDFSAFYYRPIDQSRPAQPNRLIPTGDLAGATAGLLLATGDVMFAPVVTLTRESSSAEISDGIQRLTANGSGWAIAGSLSVDFPFGRHVSIDPEAGFTAGHVSTEFLTTDLRPVLGRVLGRRTQFSDPLSGWWAGLEVSVSW